MLKADSVTTAAIADNAVETAKIKDGAVTAAKLNNANVFSVYRAGAHTSDATAKVVPYETVIKDPNGLFNTSNSRFTAPIAGYYQFNASAGNISASGTLMNCRLRINGDNAKSTIGETSSPTTSGNIRTVNAMLYLEANDYVEVLYIGGGGSVMYAGADTCYFNGFMITAE